MAITNIICNFATYLLVYCVSNNYNLLNKKSMKIKQLLTKTLLVAAGLLVGQSVWATDVPYTVGTEGTGDAFASRKYSDAYEIAPGEIYHFTFTNTSYGSNNWNNWLLDCKATADTSVDDWYFTMRADNYGWGTSYNSAMRNVDFVWGDFQTVMNGATVDMYIDYNSTDKIIRTYTTITKSETTWHYNFASKAIDESSVFLFLSEELAVLNITTAEKVASVPNGTYTLYKRTTTATDCGEQWKADDKDNIWVPSTTNANFTYAIDGGLSLANTSANADFKSAYSASRVLAPNENTTVSMTAVATMGVASGRSSSYDYLTIGGASLRVLPQGGASSSCIAQVYIDGVAQGDAVSATRNVAYTFNVEINQATGAVTYSVSGGATIAEATTSTSTAISNVVFGHSRGGSESYNTNMKLTNIDITEQIIAVGYANYTVHFQDNNGAKVKEDDVRNGEVGAGVGANSSDKASFIADGNKYVYSSDGGGTTVAGNGSAEFTITYTKYVSTAYTVNAQAGGSDIKTGIASGNAYLDGSETAYWSKYVKVGDQWYMADEATYGAAITSATTNVAYTTTDAIDYFFEFEDMSDNGAILDALSGTAISGGTSKRFNANGKKWTTALAGGTYTIDMYCNGNNGKSVTLPLYYSDADGSNPVYIGESTACQASAWALKTTTNVVIPEGKALCFYNNSSYTHNYIVDYVTLKRTSDATVTATIGSTGYTTFASSYPLNIGGMTASAGTVNAYYVTASDVKSSSVALTGITGNVAAGTGLILEGTAGAAITIPVVASGIDYTSTNKLVGCTANTDITASTPNYENFYVLIATEAAFKKIKSWVDAPNTLTIPAGKAYLDTTGAGVVGAPTLTFDLNGGATGIADVRSKMEEVRGEIYNLNGQRVAQPQKGLYIQNGRKVILK